MLLAGVSQAAYGIFFGSPADSFDTVDADMIAMFEDAFKQQPANEELGAQTFFANVRTANWKVAQQVGVFSCDFFRAFRLM